MTIHLETNQPEEKYTNISMSWDDVHDAVATLLGQFKEAKYFPLTIIGVSKGGVIPATLIHQAFPKADFYTVGVKSYCEFFQTAPEFSQAVPSDLILDYPTTLIVDDILETGGTKQFLANWRPMATFAFLACRSSVAKQAQFKGKIYGPGWVDFPWERKIEPAEIPF